MSGKKITIGLIGSGRMGSVHAQNTLKIPWAELKAVSDSDTKKAADLARECGAEAWDQERILKDDNIDAIIVATPTPFHAKTIIDAAGRGKHVCCEKPLCLNMEEAQQIEKSAALNKVQIGICFQKRFKWPETRIKKLLPMLGRPLAGRMTNINAEYSRSRDEWFGNFESCGGYTLDTMVHLFDVMRWYFGEVKSVQAEGLLLSPELPEPMDYTVVNLGFESGFFASAEGGWIRRGLPVDYTYLVGTEGTMCYDSETGIKVFTGKKNFEEKCTEHENGNLMLLRSFCKNLIEGNPVSPSLKDGIESLKIALAAIESIRSRKT